MYRFKSLLADIQISDDFGLTWVPKVQKSATDQWGQLIRGGTSGPYFASKYASSDQFGVYRSVDGGGTWEEFTVPGGGTSEEVDFANSLAYDILTDTLYLGSGDENHVYRLQNASAVTPASAVWEELPDPGSLPRHHNLVLIND